MGTPLARRAAIVMLALVALLNAGTGRASTPCSFDGEIVSVLMGGDPIRLSVGTSEEILVDDHVCQTTEDAVATQETTEIIHVTGTGGDDAVAIDESSGRAFAGSITFRIDLGEGAGNRLAILEGPGADGVTADALGIDLDASGDTDVDTIGVGALEVDGGAGDDVIDLGLSDLDAGRLGIPVTIHGGPGDDTLTGGLFDDRIYGDEDDDVLDGGDGVDVLNGGVDTDACWYGSAFDSCDQTLSLAPAQGREGTSVDASGLGWVPENGEIAISFPDASGGDLVQVASATPASDGSFSATFDVPAQAGTSSADVVACQHCTDEFPIKRVATYVYAAPQAGPTLTVTPGRGTVGERVSVAGAGWRPDEPVELFLAPADIPSGEPLAAPVAGGDGSFAASFDIPDLEPGRHRILACQGCGTESEVRVDRPFTVEVLAGTPTLRTDPEAYSGTDVRVAGLGWLPDLGDVSLSVESGSTVTSIVPTVQVEADGSFATTVPLPDLAAGSYAMRGCQHCQGADREEATSAFSVLAASSSWPWIAGAIAATFLLVGGGLLVRARVRRRRGRRLREGSPQDHVRARARPMVPDVVVVEDAGPKVGHTVRLVPKPDPGIHRVEEMSDP